MSKVEKLGKPDKPEMIKMSKKPNTEDQKVMSEAFLNLKKYKIMFSQKTSTENEDNFLQELNRETDCTFSACEYSMSSPQRDSRYVLMVLHLPI